MDVNLKTDPDPAKKPWILRYRSRSRSETLVNFELQKSELALSFAIPWIHLDTDLDPQKCLYLDPDLPPKKSVSETLEIVSYARKNASVKRQYSRH